MRTIWRSLWLGLACSTIAGPLAAESVKDIEADIARLTGEVQQARQTVDPLAAPWMRSKDLTLEVAGALLTAAVADLNGLNIARVDLAVIDHHGELWGWHSDCRIWDPLCNFPDGCFKTYGDEGEFITFKDTNYRFQANAALDNIHGTWVPYQGFRIDLHGAVHAEVGMLKGAKKPCIGGWSPEIYGGPAHGDTSGDVGALARLLGLGPSGISYALNAGVENIQYSLVINMGSLPDLVVEGTFPGVRTELGGEFGVPLALDGELALPAPAAPLKYHLELNNSAVFPTDRAVRAETDLVLRWH